MNKINIITDWINENSNPEIEMQVTLGLKRFDDNIKTAKNYCKMHKVKFEDVRGDLLIYSVIQKRKVGGKRNADGTASYKSYKDWNIIETRCAFLCKIENGDVYHIDNYIEGKHHHKDTRFIITDEMLTKNSSVGKKEIKKRV